MARFVSTIACLLVCLAAPSAMAQRAFLPALGEEWEHASEIEPIELRYDGWYFATVGSRSARGKVVDEALAQRIQRDRIGDSLELLWEGPGSGLILEGPLGYRAWMLRAEPARSYRQTQWFVHEGRARIDRTWWSYYEPISERDQRGVVVLLPGMLGTPEPPIEMLITGLRGRGWGVMRMLAHPSGYTEDYGVRTVGREPAEVANEFAMHVQCRMLSMVRSVEDALRAVSDEPGPRVLLAMSGGTLASPAILSTINDNHSAPAFDAAVLIGAGADVLTMSQTSAYAGFLGGLQLDWLGGQVDAEKLAEIVSAYREVPTLEPYHTAPLVEGVKLLMIQGSKDKAVPARLGRILWQRLGEPEQWTAAMGHELLFLGYLPMRAGDLVDWIDAVADQPAQAGGAP